VQSGQHKPESTGVHKHGTALLHEVFPFARSVETLPQDFAHNKLKGQWDAELYLAIKIFIKSKKHKQFTLKVLNARIRAWKWYKRDDVHPKPFRR
jgi:hypothetical protein